jgi:hypothetical protein
MHRHPDVASTLETLAQEFETRAALIAAESRLEGEEEPS